jgi:short-subunit dehydrogenase
MTTIAIVGAGTGLGAAVARRFAREGFAVAAISRHQDRVDALAEQLRSEGIQAQGFAADVRDPASLVRALEAATTALGTIEVLQYSPLPQKEFLRPVLELTTADATAAIEFSVLGPITAVHHVLPGMRFLGRGTIVFVNGGTAVQPRADFAGTSISFAGQSALGQALHDQLRNENIHVGQLVIPGSITAGHPDKDPEVLAEKVWTIHEQRGEYRTFASTWDA